MNKFYISNGNGTMYSAPEIEILNISIEQGFATSADGAQVPDWGAGNDNWFNPES